MKPVLDPFHRWLLATFIFLLLIGPGARAQAPAWQLAVAAGQVSASGSLVTATALAANGDVYLAGHFHRMASFGRSTLTTVNGDFDVFVAKWDHTTGTFSWARQAGGPGDDFAQALAVNGSNVYVAGTFNTSATFDGIGLTSNGATDVFVAKLSDAGSSASFTWVQNAGGAFDEQARALAVNGANVYVAGLFSANAFQGGAHFGSTTLTSVDRNDAFVAKLSDAGSTGSFTWALSAGGAGSDAATTLAVAGPSVYLAGYFSGSASFGSNILSSAGNTDVFVAKVTDAGASSSFGWTQRAGGSYDEQANALAISGSSVYIAGSFIDAASFGATTLRNANPSFMMNDVFVARLTDAGASSSFAWAQSAGGAGNDEAKALAIAGSQLYLAGSFTDNVRFGSTTLSAGGSFDGFVASLSDAGSTARFNWAQRAGGPGEDRASTIAAASSGEVFVGGSIETTAYFGSLTIGSPLGISAGFLASFTAPTLTATQAARGRLALALTPNPAHSWASVQLPAVPGAPQALLTLTDALGRVVRTHTLSLPAAGLRHELNLSGLAPGIYALRTQAGDAYALCCLVVE